MGGDLEAIKAQSWVNAELSSLRCKETSSRERVPFAIGVKTNRFYHATRARAMWEAYGHRLGHAVTFVSDGAMTEMEPGPFSVAVVEDHIDSRRKKAYVPPWRDPTVKTDEIDPFSLPQLTRRVAALVEVMYDCWHDRTDWYLIVDDDTFVRPGNVEQIISKLDPSIPQLLGVPTAADQFTRPAHQVKFGPSIHCGGSFIILSRGLVNQLVKYTRRCLAGPPRTTLAWYWDEVEFLGRCVWEFFRLNCTEPARLPVSKGELELGVALKVERKEEFDDLATYVQNSLNGKWKRLPFASLHPVEAAQMR